MANVEEDEANNGSLFIEGMFGGLLSIPLPVPEIINQLDKTKFKNKQAQKKKQNDSQTEMWRQCPICWTDFMRNDYVTSLQCNDNHVFHTECIE